MSALVVDDVQLDSDPLLSPAEVSVLADLVEAGLLAREARTSGRGFADATPVELLSLEQQGVQAGHRLVRANLRLVSMVARPAAARSNQSRTDLFQEGCLGLLTAVQRFDHRRGFRFSTYALFWIRAFVNAASAQELGAVNLPAGRAEKLRAARGLETVLTQELGRAATVAELAEALGRPARWTADLLAHQPPTSIQTLLEEDILLTTPQDEMDAVLDRQLRVGDLLGRLTGLDRRVLELRLGLDGDEPQTYTQTARSLSLTVSRVRRCETRALTALRSICPQQAWVHP